MTTETHHTVMHRRKNREGRSAWLLCHFLLNNFFKLAHLGQRYANARLLLTLQAHWYSEAVCGR